MPGAMEKVSEEDDTINIDYTDLQPGDDAPDADLAEAKAQFAQPTQTARAASANVIVLSADPVLIDLLRDSLAGTHRVWRADDAAHAADLMVAAGNAALLLDSALADAKVKDLVIQINKQFPDLPIIVAGNRDDEATLGPLISQGTVFRFLHKPASSERIRNFVDATQRRPQQLGVSATPRSAAALAAAMTGTTAEIPKLTLPTIHVDHAWV